MDNHTQKSVSHQRNAGVFRRLGGMAFAIALAGCAAGGGSRTDEDVVARRAQERWDALVKGDFGVAYQYISPAGREVVTQDAYASGLRKGFWTSAKVGDVRCTAPQVCEVDVQIEYQHWGVKMKTPVLEKWVRQGSNWWFLLER